MQRHGLLLVQDSRLPNLCAAVAGGVVRGSWWAHPAAHRIFHAYGAVADHPDVASAKLIAGKATLVHRRLWPALVAVGRAREPWQLRALPAAARALLARVDARGHVEASGPAAKTLERRLLVASEQVHTASGDHALELTTWARFVRTRRLRAGRRSPVSARAELTAATAAYAGGAAPPLPWP